MGQVLIRPLAIAQDNAGADENQRQQSSASSTNGFYSFSPTMFLREAVHSVCGSIFPIPEGKRFIAPLLPPHIVDINFQAVHDYENCSKIIAERFYSIKQGDFYGLARYLKEVTNHRLHAYFPEEFSPLEYHLEGNIMGFPEKYSILQAYANDERVETICEIGFNAGFSSLFMTLQNPKAKFYEFDIFYHNYSALALSALQEMFPTRHFLGIAGDSATSISRFHAMFPETRCNLILIDGGHSRTALRNDILNMALLANRTYHRVLIDDTAGEWTHLYEEYVSFVVANVTEDEERSMYYDLNKTESGASSVSVSLSSLDEAVRFRHIEHHFVEPIPNPCLVWEIFIHESMPLMNYVTFDYETTCAALEDQRMFTYNSSSGVCVAEYLF
jgi:hypothetical protein